MSDLAKAFNSYVRRGIDIKITTTEDKQFVIIRHDDGWSRYDKDGNLVAGAQYN